MSQYTRLHAANLLLLALGNPHNGDAAYWLCGWSKHEIQCGVGCSHPQNNLWACGQSMPGSSTWNPPHHVQNYPSLSIGIAAMVANLHDGRYQHLVSALASNDVQALASSAGVQHDLATWCGSQCYSRETGSFIADGKAAANDLFDDSRLLTPDTSCKPCRQGAIGDCPDGYFCAVSPDAPLGQPGVNGCCMPNVSPGQVASQVLGLPGWLTNPDWKRVTKFLLGLMLTGFGLLLIFSILTGKAEGNPAVQAATRTAALVGG